ncbi:hypothetical protein Tco_0851518 [Tanacetum coccineum]
MEWLPKCKELEKVVGGRNWLDMMVVYFDEYAYEQREFACRVNRLIGEMNEACADRMAFVRELRSVAGETIPAKTAAFFKEMLNKEGTIEWQLADVQREAKERVHKIEFFVGKLMRDARGKMVEFMKEMQDKDISNLMKLQILGREFELRACEKDLFIQKLKVDCWMKRALFVDFPCAISVSSFFFVASVIVLWLGAVVYADADDGVPGF